MAKGIGRFVWYDLMTSDPKAAIAFYSHVIGWKTQPFEKSDYTMFVGERGPLGGTITLPEEAKKMGARPHWTANVQVADLDATIAQARKLGGRTLGDTMDMPNVGRVAVIADPQGAALNIFQPVQAMPLHDDAKPGDFVWSELMTTDRDAGFAFYSALFGWEKLLEHDLGKEMGTYRIFGVGGKQLGGMMNKPKEMQMPSAWCHYVEIADLDAAIARAKGRDARVLNGPMEVPGGARVAVLSDPQGAVFAMHEGAKKK